MPTLVFAGRIDPLKDLDTLVRAFALVREQVPDARLRLFGGVPAGNEAYAAEIRQLVADLAWRAAPTFEGPVSPVSQAFAAGHVVVQSSLSEGLPLTVIEAAMAGRPTVVTDVGGMPEAAGRGGLVVPPGDPAAFAAACVRLLTDARDPPRRWPPPAARTRWPASPSTVSSPTCATSTPSSHRRTSGAGEGTALRRGGRAGAAAAGGTA